MGHVKATRGSRRHPRADGVSPLTTPLSSFRSTHTTEFATTTKEREGHGHRRADQRDVRRSLRLKLVANGPLITGRSAQTASAAVYAQRPHGRRRRADTGLPQAFARTRLRLPPSRGPRPPQQPQRSLWRAHLRRFNLPIDVHRRPLRRPAAGPARTHVPRHPPIMNGRNSARNGGGSAGGHGQSEA